MNRFAIEEENQFEIHVKHYLFPNKNKNYGEKIYNAAEEVLLEAQLG